MNRRQLLHLAGLAGASTLLGMNRLQDLHRFSEELPGSDPMPVLFLGHGSPMNAIEENQFVRGFRETGAALPRPAAILCVSAHWFTRGTKVTAMAMPPTIHDFGGFPEALFQVQYPAPGSPELARDTQALLAPTAVELSQEWGLDHGAWSVIKHLYPGADVPVIQMSIDYTQPPAYHFGLAKQLQSLRNKGVLIVGSGNIVHNLRMMDFRNMDKDDHGYDWAREARATVNQHLLSGDVQPLLQYHQGGQALQMAIPTPDHYLPLIYSLGVRREQEELMLFNDKMVGGSISMTSVKIG